MGDFKLKTIDQTYAEMTDRAADQSEALCSKFSAINSGYDDEDEPEAERLIGVRKEKGGRAVMVFADPDVTNARTVIYVDAILSLADLIRREPVIEGDAE